MATTGARRRRCLRSCPCLPWSRAVRRPGGGGAPGDLPARSSDVPPSRCRTGGWVPHGRIGATITHVSPKHALDTVRTRIIACRNQTLPKRLYPPPLHVGQRGPCELR